MIRQERSDDSADFSALRKQRSEATADVSRDGFVYQQMYKFSGARCNLESASEALKVTKRFHLLEHNS